MNIKALEALRAFMESGSLSGAAARIRRTQPQVSRLLSQLESDTGIRLFYRQGRRLRPTDQGRDFYGFAQHALNNFAELERAAVRLREGVDRHVRILTAPHVVGALIPDALSAISARHEGITATIDSRSRIDIDDWVGRERFDIGVAVLPIRSPIVEAETFLATRAVVVMAEDHPLAVRSVIEAADIVGQPFIANSPGSIVRKHVDVIFRELGEQADIRIETPNGMIACQLAIRGIGITVADPFVALSSGRFGLAIRPFAPAIDLPYGFLFPKWKPRSDVVSDLAGAIRQVAHDKLVAIGASFETFPARLQGDRANEARA